MPSAPEQRALQISVEESPHFGLWSSPELFALQRALSIQKNTPAFKPPASCRCLRTWLSVRHFRSDWRVRFSLR